MNNLNFLSDETGLLAKALHELKSSAGVDGEFFSPANTEPDVTVMLQIGGKTLRYRCEVKNKVDRYSLLLDLIARPGTTQHTLLVSSPLSQDMANRCRELGLQFIDTAGNAHINNGKGIYIYVSGRRGNEDVRTVMSDATMTPAVLRAMFAFLADPSLLNAPYRDISIQAMVSTGAIGKVFDTLEARGLIGTTANGKRMIRSPQLFLNEWASGYANRLKPKLKKIRFAIDDLGKFRNTWNPGLRLSAWGGEIGATYLTKHLHPEECTIYIDMGDPHALRNMVQQFRLRADPAGQIEVVDMFWNSDYFANWFPTVPPHLIYADLVTTQDSRNIAAAQQIASEVVEHVTSR
ncbi:type IV toxin-antitoxin system AbiEi family antitoxin [Massilia aerilata]|uniref:Type IV toxin-antitoxin system AbiEi family antitoxin n=1 Tax=Massilia aerilata TaxID=453817 RepID=A0ABW0S3N4_9BURK